MKHPSLLVLAALYLASSTLLAAERIEVNLREAEAAALKRSPAIQAASMDRLGAEKLAAAQKTSLLPQFNLDGSAKAIDEVPAMALVPGRPPVEFGDHKNWTAGLTASWTVWDWGALRHAWKSAQWNAATRVEAERLAKRQVRLAVRSAYLQVYLACEQAHLVADSLLLAQAQLKDAEARVTAGTAGRLDLSAARQETLARRRSLREARAALSSALRDLLNLTGQEPPSDPSLPLDEETAKNPPPDVEPASLVVALEPSSVVLLNLSSLPASASGEKQPQVLLWETTAEASRRQAKSAKASLLPRIQVTGRSSYDYPNQVLRETVQQNTAMVSASMPLFDWGRAAKQSAAARAQADAAESRRTQALDDWRRDVGKASDQFQALKAEAELDKQAAEEAVEFARLVRQSYKAGRSTYLEVDQADLKALQSQVQSARTSIQVLLQAAVLGYLTTD